MTKEHNSIQEIERNIEYLKDRKEELEELIDKEASFVINTKKYKDEYGNKIIYSGHINDQNYEILRKLGKGKVNEMGDLIYEFPNFIISLRTDTDEEHNEKICGLIKDMSEIGTGIATGFVCSGIFSNIFKNIQERLGLETTNEGLSIETINDLVEENSQSKEQLNNAIDRLIDTKIRINSITVI